MAYCSSIRRFSALAVLKKLTEEGSIIREGFGRSTYYVRVDSKWSSANAQFISSIL